MQLLYNNSFINEHDFDLNFRNRAFQFNDGFFETAIILKSDIRFWKEHLERINEAAVALRLEIPSYFNSNQFKDTLIELANRNNISEAGRLKLKIWRTGEGLYTPTTNKVDWMATIEATNLDVKDNLHVGICEQVTTAYTAISHFKGPNAPLYVLASHEKRQKGFDDMLMLDSNGHLAELTSSNLFWLKDGVFFTPSLKTGCINGVIRRSIIKWCLNNRRQCQEVFASVNELYNADAVYTSNITGIRKINTVNSIQLNQSESLHKRLIEDLKFIII